MGVARNVAEVLAEHVTVERERIDRLYLNLYVPILQRVQGIGHFFISHRGHRFASSVLMAPMMWILTRYGPLAAELLSSMPPLSHKHSPPPRGAGGANLLDAS